MIAGPQLVIGGQADEAFVISPGERPDVPQDEWFW
jgi:hypothetical protein